MTLFSQTNTKNKMLNVNFSLFLTQLVHTGGPPMQYLCVGDTAEGNIQAYMGRPFQTFPYLFHTY